MRESLLEAWPPDRDPTFTCKACGSSVLEWSESGGDDDVICCKSCGAPAGRWGDLRHVANEPLSEAFRGFCARLTHWLMWKR
jgi:hypothetical protein